MNFNEQWGPTAQSLKPLRSAYGGYIGPDITPGGGGGGSGGDGQNFMTDDALYGLKRLGYIVKFLTGLAMLLAIAGFISVFFFDLTFTTWFGSFLNWLVIIPLLLLIALWPTAYIAYKRNIIGSTYQLFIGILAIAGIIMLALLIWVLIEWFWYCPTFMPDVCTNGSTSAIERGFMIYAIVVILEAIMVFVFLAVLWAMRNAYRRLTSGMSSMSKEAAARFIYEAMTGGTTRYVTGIGMQYV